MCPSSAHNADAAAENKAAQDPGGDDSSEERADSQDSHENQDSNDSRDGESGDAARPDVAPDPEQTGIEIEKSPRIEELSEEEIEKQRKERLAPENRPEGAEVDNTDRTFDTKAGKFTDSDSDSDVGPFEDPENPNENSSDDDDDE